MGNNDTEILCYLQLTSKGICASHSLKLVDNGNFLEGFQGVSRLAFSCVGLAEKAQQVYFESWESHMSIKG